MRKCKKQNIFNCLFRRASLPSLSRRPHGLFSATSTGMESSYSQPKGPEKHHLPPKQQKRLACLSLSCGYVCLSTYKPAQFYGWYLCFCLSTVLNVVGIRLLKRSREVMWCFRCQLHLHGSPTQNICHLSAFQLSFLSNIDVCTSFLQVW